MDQLVLHAPGSLSWRSAPEPVLDRPTAAIVAPVAASTCDFDHLVVGGRTPLPLPIAIGHEFVADVVAIGAAVTSVAPGDRVVVAFQVSCGSCGNCRRGLTSACEAVPWLSCYGLGAFAGDHGSAVSDAVAVPFADAMLRRLPANVAPEAAAAVGCNVVDAYRSVGPQLAARPGGSVLVVGGAFGNISLYAVQLAVALGAGAVTYASPVAAQAERAAGLGADVVAVDALGERRHDITVDASQDPVLLARAIRATADGGTVTSTTMYPDPTTPVPLMDMFERCLTYRTGQPHAAALLDEVLDLAAAGVVHLDAVVDEVVDWHDATRAFASGAGKTVCRR